MTEKQLYDIINMEEPRRQSVTYKGIPCTARTCVTRLNRLTKENEQLKQKVDELYENDKILRKQLVQDGILVKTDYFRETMKLLKELGHDDLYNDLNTTSLDMSVNCRG